MLGSRRIVEGIWLICFFVCPLIFFTDLTRNPYDTQIVLLNIAAAAVVAVCAWRSVASSEWRLPRTPLDASLGAWSAICLASWFWAYTHHAPFFIPAIKSQGLAAAGFLAACVIAPFYFGAFHARTASSEKDPTFRARWAIFFLAWGALWTLHSAIVASAPPLTLEGHFWDFYGGALWILGFAALFLLSKSATVQDYWRVLLGVAFLSGVYGICQYFGVEMIWPRMLNPYGGRSVSTFGNPNFISSFMVLMLPVAVLFLLKAKRWPERLVYAAVCVAMEGCLLSSLTRSSWIGALVGVGMLFAWRSIRGLIMRQPRIHAALLAVAALLVIAWPHTSVQGSTPTVLGRVEELGRIFESKPVEVYSPFYQRVLIWTCSWQMGNENPLLGKGWGLFENFYPFYQGNLLAHFDLFRNMRTHGNGAHNELLQAWSETGLLGLGSILWMWTVFFLCVWRWLKAGSADEWALASAAGVAGMLADNMLNVSLHFAVPAFLFWWQVGTTVGLSRPEGDAWRRWKWPHRLPAAAAALVTGLCLLFGTWWFKQWNRDMHYFLGFKQFHAGRVPAAIDELETAYQWNAHEVNADYELGNAYARAERYNKAVWAYGEAIRANSGYDEIYYNIGTLLMQRLGKTDEGLDNLRVAHWINPLMLEASAALSAYYMNHLDRFQSEARSILEESAHFYPDSAPILANLGYLYGLDHDDAKSSELQARALRIDPDLTIAEQNYRAVLAREGKKSDPLMQDLQTYRDLESRIGKKDYSDGTLELARRTVEAFPNAVKPRLFLGNLEALHGHVEEALKWLEPLTSILTKDAGLWQNLGELYLREGRRNDAVAAYRKAIQLDPNNPSWSQRLEQLGQVSP